MVTNHKSEPENTKTKTKEAEKDGLKKATRASVRNTTKKVVESPIKLNKKAPPPKVTKKEVPKLAPAKPAPKKTPVLPKKVPTTTTTTTTATTTTATTKPTPKKAPAAKVAPKKALVPKRKPDKENSDIEEEDDAKSKKQKTDAPVIPAEVPRSRSATPVPTTSDFLIDVPIAPFADVMTMGSGEVGQLGLGKAILGRKRPTPLPELQNKHILKLTPGGLHNAVIVQNDPANDPTNTSVWTWGCNDNAVLGRSTPPQPDEDIDLSMKPDVCPELEGKRIVDISTGEYHMAALTCTGILYMWGNYKDNEGFLGYSGSQKTEQAVPKIYPKAAPLTIKQVVSGHNHTIALTASGKVYIWGFHWLGRRVSERMKRMHLDPQPINFHKKNGKEPKIVKVAAGGYHSFALSDDGTVYAWGLNNNGQLGINSTIDQGAPTEVEGLKGKNIIDITGGMHHTVALGADGKVYTFGRGDYGQLGNGTTTGSKIPIEVPFFSSLGDKVVHIGTGDNHCTAVTESGAVYAWGFGESGQIGNADKDSDGEDANVPFKVAGPKLVTKVLTAGGGGQHTVFLVESAEAPPPPLPPPPLPFVFLLPVCLLFLSFSPLSRLSS
eukprot:Phypoly_transcript_03561.p1 GENE.Phypoly_transcript_03561~~Phypoly_transcript_03561.p1  ORF type:complete len:607 (-),score=131.38 Phypoly_transcript_03561:534-2354(-)